MPRGTAHISLPRPQNPGLGECAGVSFYLWVFELCCASGAVRGSGLDWGSRAPPSDYSN